jgi:hypothetical protein
MEKIIQLLKSRDTSNQELGLILAQAEGCPKAAMLYWTRLQGGNNPTWLDEVAANKQLCEIYVLQLPFVPSSIKYCKNLRALQVNSGVGLSLLSTISLPDELFTLPIKRMFFYTFQTKDFEKLSQLNLERFGYYGNLDLLSNFFEVGKMMIANKINILEGNRFFLDKQTQTAYKHCLDNDKTYNHRRERVELTYEQLKSFPATKSDVYNQMKNAYFRECDAEWTHNGEWYCLSKNKAKIHYNTIPEGGYEEVDGVGAFAKAVKLPLYWHCGDVVAVQWHDGRAILYKYGKWYKRTDWKNLRQFHKIK